MSDTAQHLCRIYLISPPEISLRAFPKQLCDTLNAGHVACFQLRLKEADDKTIRNVSRHLLPICQEHGVAFLVNDRPDLAVDVGADGVHVGAKDETYAAARSIVGKESIVGVSCYDSLHSALIAGEEGADYVAFGAFYPTKTKQPRTRAEPKILSWWRKATTVPSVAIGGITVDNCGPLIRAGADFLAVISGVWNHPRNPETAISLFNDEIAKHSNTGTGEPNAQEPVLPAG